MGCFRLDVPSDVEYPCPGSLQTGCCLVEEYQQGSPTVPKAPQAQRQVPRQLGPLEPLVRQEPERQVPPIQAQRQVPPGPWLLVSLLLALALR
jgi:hypothetical protein